MSNKQKNKNSKKINKITIFLITLTLLISLLICGVIYYINNILNKVNTVELNSNELGINQEIEEKLSTFGDIQNIALFGVDATDGHAGRSDSIMIATIDRKHNKLKLTSIMRDSYVPIDGHGKDKINHAYAFGGPQLAIKTLNENFDLNVKDFITVNFSSLPKIIDDIGGIDLNITTDELKYINNYIDGLNGYNKTSVSHIDEVGIQHINGTQAMAYCRIRYTAGGDYERTERHRTVLTKVFEKIKTLPVTEYPKLLNEFLPMVHTNLSKDDILALTKEVLSMKNTPIEQERFPRDNYCKGEMIHGVWYLTFNREATVQQIHDWIFEDKK